MRRGLEELEVVGERRVRKNFHWHGCSNSMASNTRLQTAVHGSGVSSRMAGMVQFPWGAFG